ncbi:unnamed protein product [Lepidochelys kempii]
MMETTSNKGVRQHPLLPAPMGLITFMRKGGKWPGWLQKEWGKQTAEPHPGTHNSSEETLVAKPFPSQGRKEPEPAARGTFDWPQLPSAGRKRGTSSNQDEQRTVPLLSCREQTGHTWVTVVILLEVFCYPQEIYFHLMYKLLHQTTS